MLINRSKANFTAEIAALSQLLWKRGMIPRPAFETEIAENDAMKSEVMIRMMQLILADLFQPVDEPVIRPHRFLKLIMIQQFYTSRRANGNDFSSASSFLK